MKRREFLTYTGVGTAALLAGCSPAPPASTPAGGAAPAAAPGAPAAGQQATGMTTVTIDFIGGFAYVWNGTNLVAGSVLTSHHPMHGMELQLVAGGAFTDKTSIPSAAAAAGQTALKHRWIMDGQVGAFGGLAGGVTLPSDSNKDTLPVPTAAAQWNDLSYIHRLQRYHSGSKLKTGWEKSLHAKLGVSGGTVSLVEPNDPCMLKGEWRGVDAGGTQKFLKPLATIVRVTAQVANDLVLTFDNAESITFSPNGGKVDLKVYASSLIKAAPFKKSDQQHHMAMFYELVQDASGNAIAAKDQVLPEFWSWNGGNDCAPTGAFIPGEGCSPNFFSA